MSFRVLTIVISMVSAAAGAGLGLVTPVSADLTPVTAEASAPPASEGNVISANSTIRPPDTTTTIATVTTPPLTTLDPSEPPVVSSAFVVASDEVRADAKSAATLTVHQLTNYALGTSLDELVGRVTDDPDLARPLARRAALLHHPDAWSRSEVVYPQLGGLNGDRASVMVVVRQEVGVGAEPILTRTRTLDVRLRLVDRAWTFDWLAADGGPVVARPDGLSPEAVAVLDDPRIELPDSARWDIFRGQTSPVLLRLMAELAEITPFGVVALSSGHPRNVFATDRVSNHTVGRAIDIYLLGETRVVDDRTEGSATHQLVQWLNEHPDVYELGTPWPLEKTEVKSFTNEVHQDHIHIAVHATG